MVVVMWLTRYWISRILLGHPGPSSNCHPNRNSILLEPDAPRGWTCPTETYCCPFILGGREMTVGIRRRWLGVDSMETFFRIWSMAMNFRSKWFEDLWNPHCVCSRVVTCSPFAMISNLTLPGVWMGFIFRNPRFGVLTMVVNWKATIPNSTGWFCLMPVIYSTRVEGWITMISSGTVHP